MWDNIVTYLNAGPGSCPTEARHVTLYKQSRRTHGESLLGLPGRKCGGDAKENESSRKGRRTSGWFAPGGGEARL